MHVRLQGGTEKKKNIQEKGKSGSRSMGTCSSEAEHLRSEIPQEDLGKGPLTGPEEAFLTETGPRGVLKGSTSHSHDEDRQAKKKVVSTGVLCVGFVARICDIRTSGVPKGEMNNNDRQGICVQAETTRSQADIDVCGVMAELVLASQQFGEYVHTIGRVTSYQEVLGMTVRIVVKAGLADDWSDLGSTPGFGRS